MCWDQSSALNTAEHHTARARPRYQTRTVIVRRSHLLNMTKQGEKFQVAESCRNLTQLNILSFGPPEMTYHSHTQFSCSRLLSARTGTGTFHYQSKRRRFDTRTCFNKSVNNTNLKQQTPRLDPKHLSNRMVRVRFHIIRNARTENVGKSQSCMVSKLRIIWKQTVVVQSRRYFRSARALRSRSMREVLRSGVDFRAGV